MIIMNYFLGMSDSHFLIGKLDLSVKSVIYGTSRRNIWEFFPVKESVYLTRARCSINHGIYIIDFLEGAYVSTEQFTKALIKLEQLGIDEDRELEEL